MNDVAAVLEVNDSLQALRVGALHIRALEMSVITDSDRVILASSLRKNRTLEKLVMVLDTLPGWMQEFVWSLRQSHLKTLVINTSRAVDEVVLSQQKDRGLPPLELVYDHFMTLGSYFRP